MIRRLLAAPRRRCAASALTLVGACGTESGDDDGGTGTARRGLHPAGPPGARRARRPEGEVNIVAWAGYVEDGSTDPAVDWVTPFEKETGCRST